VKPRVYIETSVISFLTARPSRDLLVAAAQAWTEDWWRFHRPECEAFISEAVLREVREGDEEASLRRLGAVQGVPVLATTREARALADLLMKAHALPTAAETDAAHIAIAAVNGMHILLTWNCRHIAHPLAMPRIRDIIEKAGLESPTIATPQTWLESLGDLLC
jgi:hypothetical protein